MKIVVNHRTDYRDNKPVETYSRSYVHYLAKAGHEVTEIGEGLCDWSTVEFRNFDLLLDIDSGRNKQGELPFIGDKINRVKKAVIFTDSHGHPTLHKRLSPHYNHVFFAVWSRRDLFAKHSSAHFLPNATDLRWFSPIEWGSDLFTFDFGFHGSKHGLDRADKLKEICAKNGWSHDVRQITNQYKQRWPHTALAMGQCLNLFNCGQKHDINLRWFESMACKRPLISDRDPMSGVDNLFQPWVHYVPYEAYTFKGLEEGMAWMLSYQDKCKVMAEAAYNLVKEKHTVENRVAQLLEVVK